MFDFGFDNFDDSSSNARLQELVDAYETHGTNAYFDSNELEAVATYYYEQGAFENALAVIDHLLDLHPYSADGWLRRGILLNNLGRYQEALRTYQKAREQIGRAHV